MPTPTTARAVARGMLLALVLVASTARADGPTSAQKETARGQMQLGDQSFAAGDFSRALDAYRSADAIMGVPTTAWAVGKTYARLGKLVEAVDALQRAKLHPKRPGEPDVFAKARAQAAELDADLARRIPTIVITVRGPGSSDEVTLYIDGAPVERATSSLPQRVNPGAHAVEARAEGYTSAEQTIDVTEGERAAVELVLARERVETAAPSGEETPPGEEESAGTAMTVAFVGFGVAGAGLVAGVITGALSYTRAKELEERCPGGVCSESDRGEQESIIALANGSNASLAVGGVGLAVGIGALIFALQTEPDAAAPVEPVIGLGSMGVRGSF
jgi:hypothetical protein